MVSEELTKYINIWINKNKIMGRVIPLPNEKL
jgi:hypothetical protein